jgi:Phosphopantetheine attachment site
MAKRRRDITAKVLGLFPDQTPLSRSFTSFGGDSITAIQTSVRLRSEGLVVKTKDILQSKSIS